MAKNKKKSKKLKEEDQSNNENNRSAASTSPKTTSNNLLNNSPSKPTKENQLSKEIATILNNSLPKSKSEKNSSQPTEINIINCSICYNKNKNPAYCNKCLHCFCLSCISEWANHSNQCPICRTEFDLIYYDVKSSTDYNVIPVQRRTQRNYENNFVPDLTFNRTISIISNPNTTFFSNINRFRNPNENNDQLRRFYTINEPQFIVDHDFNSMNQQFQNAFDVTNNNIFLDNLFEYFRNNGTLSELDLESLENIMNIFENNQFFSPKDSNFNITFRRRR